MIATKKMIDDRFKKTVIVMLENNKDGAWGLVINKPLGSVPLALLIDPSLSSLKERGRSIQSKNSNILGWTCRDNNNFCITF